MSWFKPIPTEIEVLRQEKEMLHGKITALKHALRNTVFTIETLRDADLDIAHPEWRKRQAQVALDSLRDVSYDPETEWVSKRLYDRSRGELARAVKWVSKHGEQSDLNRALQAENELLRKEVESLTTMKMRISYHQTIEHRDGVIRALKDQLKKKNEFIRSKLGG